MSDKLKLSPQEWRARLDGDTYHVTREKGTERPGSSPLLKVKDKGVFACACCGAPLFHSEAKYESGTGWPSFFAPIEPGAVATERDASHGMVRTEALCAHCEAHLGHVFPDGPEPTGLRYCMNGLSLTFKKDNEEK